jgi:hypothetical protein
LSGWVGTASLALTMCGVVMAIFPGLQTGSAAILVGKDALLGALNTITLVCGAIMLWSPAASRLRPVLLPVLLLAATALWMALGHGAERRAGLRVPRGLSAADQRRRRRGRAPLSPHRAPHPTDDAGPRPRRGSTSRSLASLPPEAIAGSTGSRTESIRAMSSRAPRTSGPSRNADALGGGLGRSPLRSSFGNPEYVGGFLVAAFLLGAMSGVLNLLRGRERLKLLPRCGSPTPARCL